MNKSILIILFFTFSVFISVGAVCANHTTWVGDCISTGNNDTNLSFEELNATINSGNDVIEITKDYSFNRESDANFIGGIQITRDNLVIEGNNHTIDADNQARFFKITGHI